MTSVRLFALFTSDALGGQAGADAFYNNCMEADAARCTMPRDEIWKTSVKVDNPPPAPSALQASVTTHSLIILMISVLSFNVEELEVS